MPKIKRKSVSKKKVKKGGKDSQIGLYLLLGIGLFVLIYWLGKEPDLAKFDEPTEDRIAKTEQSAKPVKKSAVAKAPAQKTDPNLSEARVESSEPSFEDILKASFSKLDIPESAIKRRKKDKLISFLVPIDRSKMDLTFANMIIKGDAERAQGKLKQGSEKSGRQTLVFVDKNGTQYSVELFFDAKLYGAKVAKKTIAIVIDDFGDISDDLLNGFLSLDREVCFAIFPDAPQSVSTMQKANSQGRETLIHIPMEPLNYPVVNPGKNAILVTMNEAEIERRVHKFATDMSLCIGANNHMGSLATTDESIMQPVMSTLKKHGMYFLDSRTSNVSVAYQVAQKSHIPAYRNDIFLDTPNLSEDNLRSKIAQIVEMSNSKTNLIAITHCHSIKHLEYLRKFISLIKAAGFEIIPVSQIGKNKIPTIL